jgi:hypothetical protein
VIDDGRLILTLLGMLTGSLCSAWLAHRLWRRRFDRRLREAVDELHAQHTGLLDKYRSAHARLNAELEQQRAGTSRQVAAAVAEPRAALLRLEDRLKRAYAELDRLREGTSSRQTVRPVSEDTQGFAATQPMHNGM